MNQIEIILNVICSTLLDPLVLEQARRRKGAFSRNSGKLPFWTVMKLLLKNTKLSISASLDGFFTDLRLRMGLPITETPRCSQQAFSKARSGVDHTIFQTCFERVLDVLCRSDSHEYCHRLGGPWGRQVPPEVESPWTGHRLAVLSINVHEQSTTHFWVYPQASWSGKSRGCGLNQISLCI